MYQRFIEKSLEDALADTRVVLLNGARQTGKSTIARAMAEERNGQYLTLDDPAVAGLAKSDPVAFIDGAGDFLVIDEIQHAPELFPAIKMSVDRDPRPGRFLLTGSANIFLLPKLSESLAGRMEILPLQPLAQAEIDAAPSDFIQELFAETALPIRTSAVDRADVCRRIVTGGYPELPGRKTAERRNAWFRSYIGSLLQRDVRDLANIEGLTDLPRLLSLLAARITGLTNISEVSRAAGLAHTTLRRYLSLLEAIFILQPLPAWSPNLGKRLVKSPKLHLIDSGLAAYLRGETDSRALLQSPSFGGLLEQFVVQEIRKLIGFSGMQAAAYHFRTSDGYEVDMVLEGPDQALVGIEIKASANIDARSFRGLKMLADTAKNRFHRGILLYMGEKVLPFGDRMTAAPISMLWRRWSG
jgi:hypothetical protein